MESVFRPFDTGVEGALVFAVLSALAKREDVVQTAAALAEDCSLTKWADFKAGVAFMLLFVGFRAMALKRLPAFHRGFIMPEKRTPDRIARWVTCMFKFMFYLGTTIIDICMFWGAEWIPKELGGPFWGTSDEYYRVIEDVTTNFAFTPGVKFYLQFQWGYHMHSLVWTVLGRLRGDCCEMMVHHVVTVVLVTLCIYTGNAVYPGIVVLIIHDVVDIFVYGTKAITDGGCDPITVFMLLGITASWIWFRLVAFARSIIWVLARHCREQHLNVETFKPFGDEKWPPWAFLGLLLILYGLHIYWFYLVCGLWAQLLKQPKNSKGVDSMLNVYEDKFRDTSRELLLKKPPKKRTGKKPPKLKATRNLTAPPQSILDTPTSFEKEQ